MRKAIRDIVLLVITFTFFRALVELGFFDKHLLKPNNQLLYLQKQLHIQVVKKSDFIWVDFEFTDFIAKL